MILNTLYMFLMLFSYADKEPADNLTKLAVTIVDDLLSKTRSISKGIIYNVHQSLLKEWGLDSLGVLPEDTMQELLTGVTFQNYLHFITSFFVSAGNNEPYQTIPNSFTLFSPIICFLSLPGFEFIRTSCPA